MLSSSNLIFVYSLKVSCLYSSAVLIHRLASSGRLYVLQNKSEWSRCNGCNWVLIQSKQMLIGAIGLLENLNSTWSLPHLSQCPVINVIMFLIPFLSYIIILHKIRICQFRFWNRVLLRYNLCVIEWRKNKCIAK